MSKDSFLLQNKFNIVISFIILMVFIYLLFSIENSYEIKTIDITNSKVEVVDEVERKTVSGTDIKLFFSDNLGFEDENLFDRYDSEYVLLNEKDITNFYPIYYKFQTEMGLVYKPNSSDCDDHAKTFSRYFTLIWNRDRDLKISPAIGYFAYLTRNDRPHMIVIVFTEKNSKLHPIFYEIRPELIKIELTESEFMSIIGGEMN